MNAFLTAVRRMRPVDLLLPIGAALISAGLQNLADREHRQRERLDQLAELAGDHLQALAAAGVAVPDELAVDEPHPLDPGIPWMPVVATRLGDDEPDEPPAGRHSWKLAALALLGVAGGIAIHRTGGVTALIDGLRSEPWPMTPDDIDHAAGMAMPVSHVHEGDPDEPCSLCGRGFDLHLPRKFPCDVEGPHGSSPDHTCSSNLVEPSTDDVCVGSPECGHEYPAGVSPLVSPLETCGWTGCDWTSEAGRSELGQRTQAAIHRNKCFHRPAGAAVTPA